MGLLRLAVMPKFSGKLTSIGKPKFLVIDRLREICGFTMKNPMMELPHDSFDAIDFNAGHFGDNHMENTDSKHATFRLSKRLLRKLKMRAAREERLQHEIVEEALDQYLGQKRQEVHANSSQSFFFQI